MVGKKLFRYSTKKQQAKQKRNPIKKRQTYKKSTPKKPTRKRSTRQRLDPARRVDPFIVKKRNRIHNNMTCPAITAVLSKTGALPEMIKDYSKEKCVQCLFCYPSN